MCPWISSYFFCFVLISHEIALDTRLMLLSFFSYNPVILYITLLVENAKNMFSIFRVISAIISFLVAVVRDIPVSKRVDVSRQSIYMN